MAAAAGGSGGGKGLLKRKGGSGREYTEYRDETQQAASHVRPVGYPVSRDAQKHALYKAQNKPKFHFTAHGFRRGYKEGRGDSTAGEARPVEISHASTRSHAIAKIKI